MPTKSPFSTFTIPSNTTPRPSEVPLHLFPSVKSLYRMSKTKTIYIVRHGQGQHNVSPENPNVSNPTIPRHLNSPSLQHHLTFKNTGKRPSQRSKPHPNWSRTMLRTPLPIPPPRRNPNSHGIRTSKDNTDSSNSLLSRFRAAGGTTTARPNGTRDQR